MIAAEKTVSTLMDRMPLVRGHIEADVRLARFTWFKVGGVADIVFSPKDEHDLADFLSQKPKDVPVTVIGFSSNLMIRDGGVRGVVIRLGGEFTSIKIAGDRIHAGAGAANLNVARKAQSAGLGGFAFLSGIPGNIGGGVVMNAGAYGSDISKVLESITVVDGNGLIKTITNKELAFTYRHSSIDKNWVITSATLQGQPQKQIAIAAEMAEIQSMREQTQPVRSLTGGSTFKNPDGYKAWQLIQDAGCRGLTYGAAEVSNQHCNFLINRGGATAADLESLGEEVRRRVMERFGIQLEWEIHIIGDTVSAEINEVTA